MKSIIMFVWSVYMLLIVLLCESDKVEVCNSYCVRDIRMSVLTSFALGCVLPLCVLPLVNATATCFVAMSFCIAGASIFKCVRSVHRFGWDVAFVDLKVTAYVAIATLIFIQVI